jgi:hypothetical protein
LFNYENSTKLQKKINLIHFKWANTLLLEHYLRISILFLNIFLSSNKNPLKLPKVLLSLGDYDIFSFLNCITLCHLTYGWTIAINWLDFGYVKMDVLCSFLGISDRSIFSDRSRAFEVVYRLFSVKNDH